MGYNINLQEIKDFCCEDINFKVFYFEEFAKDLRLIPTPKVIDVLYKDMFIEFKRVVPNEKKGEYYSSIAELEENLKIIALRQLKEWNIEKKIVESKKIAMAHLKKDIKRVYILFCYAEENSFIYWLRRSFKNITTLALLKKTNKVDFLEIYDKFYKYITENCSYDNGDCDKLRAMILIDKAINDIY